MMFDAVDGDVFFGKKQRISGLSTTADRLVSFNHRGFLRGPGFSSIASLVICRHISYRFLSGFPEFHQLPSTSQLTSQVVCNFGLAHGH